MITFKLIYRIAVAWFKAATTDVWADCATFGNSLLAKLKLDFAVDRLLHLIFLDYGVLRVIWYFHNLSCFLTLSHFFCDELCYLIILSIKLITNGLNLGAYFNDYGLSNFGQSDGVLTMKPIDL